MTPEERDILRKALIEIDCISRNADKVLNKIMQYSLEMTISLPKLRDQAKRTREILQEIPIVKKRLLKDLKMPEIKE